MYHIHTVLIKTSKYKLADMETFDCNHKQKGGNKTSKTRMLSEFTRTPYHTLRNSMGQKETELTI